MVEYKESIPPYFYFWRENMKKTFYIKIVSIICLISILLTSCVTDINRFENLEYVDTVYSGKALHTADISDFQVVSKSGLIEMLFDKNTATVAIHDTNSGTVWTTLPEKVVTKKLLSSAIEIKLSDGGNKIYTLNSQDNAVAFRNFEYTSSVDGVSVTYSMALDKETGAKKRNNLNRDDIRADLTVLYTLQDGSFYVYMSMNQIWLPEGIYLEDITFLNDFGAYENSDVDDYIFVPDGCGAIIKTGVDDADFSPISLTVYGEDVATTDNRNGTRCLIGAFGIKHNDSAFLCIIEEGEEIAKINANRNNDASLNSVNASFKITDVYSEKVQSTPYASAIKLCYRFLSGKSATYSGMATACRENLIRNSVLSTKSVNVDSEYLPMVVSLQGGYVDAKGKYHKLSNYKQTLSLMTLLKAKGVNNVYLRYNGLYDNANNGNKSDFDSLNGTLGNKSDYNELYTYLGSQKFSLFIDTDILTYDNSLSGALSINKKWIVDKNTYSFPCSTASQEFLKIGKLENAVENILADSEKISFDGYCLNDAGRYLYSDYSHDSYSRSLAESELFSQISVLSTSKLLMVDTGNFYSLKNADIVSNIPVSTFARVENSAYESIPFVQMLLHGIVEYSAIGANTVQDLNSAFLKSVEYGCLPSADWYCSTFDKAIDEKYYYDNNINDIVLHYIKANASFAELRDARMTSHYKIQDGVFCTEYDNSIKTYVNYTNESVTVNGIIINPMDYITIS